MILYLQIQIVIRNTTHSHDGNSETVEAIKIRSILKETATTSRGTPAQFIADQTAHIPVEIRAAMGVRVNLSSAPYVGRRPSSIKRTQQDYRSL